MALFTNIGDITGLKLGKHLFKVTPNECTQLRYQTLERPEKKKKTCL
jgi:hypothetical protein